MAGLRTATMMKRTLGGRRYELFGNNIGVLSYEGISTN
jgi:hypothetical protein